MPIALQHIDAIAREKQRDVLYVIFNQKQPVHYRKYAPDYDYHQDPKRQALCAWLDEQGITWYQCGIIAVDGLLVARYLGDIYIDVPFDETNATYQKLRDHLETPSGQMRDEHVTFCFLTLERAMQNAHHDAPGYWDDW